ncbi:MAG: hypothetical protein D6805_09995 [Planctomycetota bacterium]|nr:MAG: hypothetical protein D6805_09995 [Planctomycetota bacterium]
MEHEIPSEKYDAHRLRLENIRFRDYQMDMRLEKTDQAPQFHLSLRAKHLQPLPNMLKKNRLLRGIGDILGVSRWMLKSLPKENPAPQWEEILNVLQEIRTLLTLFHRYTTDLILQEVRKPEGIAGFRSLTGKENILFAFYGNYQEDRKFPYEGSFEIEEQDNSGAVCPLASWGWQASE